MTDFTVEVLRRTQEAEDIVVFELGRPDGAPLPPFSAGSHIDVYVPEGPTRQYSLCNEAGNQSRYRIAVLRDPNTRGGSARLHDQVVVGDTLQISEPRNHFPLVHSEQRSLLFAGGIGITPLLCMAMRLDKIGADFAMHYCARSASRAAFASEIRSSPFGERVSFHFDDCPEQRLDLKAVLESVGKEAHIYTCGPGGFIDFIVEGAKRAGFGDDQVHLEYFASTQKLPVVQAAFVVKLASTGRVIPVGAQQTVVEALISAGVPVRTSCEQGVCGVCLTRVLEGVCDHRDLFLTPMEQARNDQFTPCCSRSKTPVLVLDL